MTTGGGELKAEEPVCGEMNGVEGSTALAMGEWAWERLSVVPLRVLAYKIRFDSTASQLPGEQAEGVRW